MTWLEAIKKSIRYIEEHLTDELTVEQIANEVYISPLKTLVQFTKRFTKTAI